MLALAFLWVLFVGDRFAVRDHLGWTLTARGGLDPFQLRRPTGDAETPSN